MVAAVIPALNEEKTIGNVVDALKKSTICDEIIVVSDGSTDRTTLYARNAGAKVIVHETAQGKAQAMASGVAHTSADIIFFCDADLRGFTGDHVRTLVEPVQNEKCDMCVGLRDRGQLFFSLSRFLPLISGERALRRKVFEEVPESCKKGFMIEIALNYVCKKNSWRIRATPLRGLSIRKKISKVGIVKGVKSYIKMCGEVIYAYFLIRFAYK